MTKSAYAGMTNRACDVRDGFFLMQAFVGMMVRVGSVVKKRKNFVTPAQAGVGLNSIHDANQK